MKRTIFYSWQSESPDHTNQSLIRAALEGAAKRLDPLYIVDEALRDEPGSPMILEAIRTKIPLCGAFVADVTLLAGTNGRKYCNSSVCVEYGLALAELGQRQIIPVFNAYSGRVDELPFDLKSMGVKASYHLSPDASIDQLSVARAALEDRLLEELRLILGDPRSIFRLSDEAVQIAEHISRAARLGRNQTEHFASEQLAEATGLDLKVVKRTTSDLESRGYVRSRQPSGPSTGCVEPTAKLFWDFDPFVHSWRPREDARALALALIESSEEGQGRLNTRVFSEARDWPARRLSPALEYLTLSGLVEQKLAIGRDGACPTIFELPSTQAFLRGDYDPDSRRRS